MDMFPVFYKSGWTLYQTNSGSRYAVNGANVRIRRTGCSDSPEVSIDLRDAQGLKDFSLPSIVMNFVSGEYQLHSIFEQHQLYNICRKLLSNKEFPEHQLEFYLEDLEYSLSTSGSKHWNKLKKNGRCDFLVDRVNAWLTEIEEEWDE